MVTVDRKIGKEVKVGMEGTDEALDIDVQVDEKDLRILELFRLLSADEQQTVIGRISELQSAQ